MSEFRLVNGTISARVQELTSVEHRRAEIQLAAGELVVKLAEFGIEAQNLDRRRIELRNFLRSNGRESEGAPDRVAATAKQVGGNVFGLFVGQGLFAREHVERMRRQIDLLRKG